MTEYDLTEPRNFQKTHDESQRLPGLRLKMTSAIGSVLAALLILAFTLFTYEEFDVFKREAQDIANRILLDIESTHTQSMLNRVGRNDDDPVIRALDEAIKHLSDRENNISVWLVMGTKVLAYQLKNGNEQEPPKDEVDREAIKSGLITDQFIDNSVYRLSKPIILGQGEAKDPKCVSCHGKEMGIRDGEIIGLFSISYDASDNYAAVYSRLITVGSMFVAIALIVMVIIFYLIERTVGRPIREISDALRRIASEEEGVHLPQTTNSRELSEIVAAAHVFKDYASSMGQKIKSQQYALDEHAIVSITDVKGNITHANRKFSDISLYSQEELIGANHRILSSGEHPPEFFVDMWKTISNGGTWQGDIKNRNKDGGYYWVRTTIVPTLNSLGKPIQYVGIRTDITKNKEIESSLIEVNDESKKNLLELAASQDRLEAAAADQVALSEDLSVARDLAESSTAAKSEFLASMSHEIRTPMTGVIGFADMLLEDDLAKSSRDKVYKIKDATRSLLRIINDILDMSKLEAGKMEIENIDFHMPSLIQDVISLFEEKRKGDRSKNLGLDTNLSNDFPIGVNSDSTRVRQILINLIGNAVKFTESGSVTVEGSLCKSDDEQDYLRIDIHDTGIGMTPETLAKLFSEFTQADASISRRFEGSGLGLSICKRLVHLMGGEIGAESEFGAGSTFWFTIPFVTATTEVFDHAQDSLNTTILYQASRPLKILIAEDNKINQEIVMATITSFGHQSDIVENGVKAVEAHDAGQYDLILMDVRMPEMSGPDATRVIRQMSGSKRKIPIIALTADAMEEHKVGYFEAGMDDVATKPIDRAELALTINKVMNEEIHIPVEVELPTPASEDRDDGSRENVDSKELDAAIEDIFKKLETVE